MQTSTVTVSVLPLISKPEIAILEKDLEWQTMRSDGCGGQNVNKVESAVRLRHLPSGIEVKCRETRKQGKNKAMALKMLYSRLKVMEENKHSNKKRKEKRKQRGTGQRGDKIRTYRYQNYIVTNHTNGKKVSLHDILMGKLDLLR